MNFLKLIIITTTLLLVSHMVNAQVQYNMVYDSGTQTYTVSMVSAAAYSGGLARLSSSTQVSVVFPHTAGGFQISNLTNLQSGVTALSWGFARIDAPTENPSKDYLVFAPANAGSYTPFDIPAGIELNLFSFQSGSGCLGDLAIFDNAADPLNSNGSLNPGNNFVVLGGGPSNQFTSAISGNVSCSSTEVTYCLSYDSGTEVYTVSMESNQPFTGGLARMSSSTQISIVAPHTSGGFQITDLTGLQAGATPLDWGVTTIEAPVENTSEDYLFFAPANAPTYTPFDIPGNTSIDLFSFKSGSGCLGNLHLFDNTTDPLNSNTGLNSDNSISILGAGAGNKYSTNCAGHSVSCTSACAANAGTLGY